MLLAEFDAQRALIEPSQVFKRNPAMPGVCLGVFSHLIVDEWVERYGGAPIDTLLSVTGDRPVYKLNVDGFEFALFVPYLSGPAAGSAMENIIALGAAHFVFAGCCGVLRHDIADGHLIVPTAAIRDEGLSYHYAPPGDEIELSGHTVEIAKSVLNDLGLPFVSGKTWTTDAFFRETPKKVERAKQMGAICVEMECASLAAVAQFREVGFLQFLWSADSLAAPEWDARGINTKGASVSEVCMTAAIEMGRRCAGQ